MSRPSRISLGTEGGRDMSLRTVIPEPLGTRAWPGDYRSLHKLMGISQEGFSRCFLNLCACICFSPVTVVFSSVHVNMVNKDPGTFRVCSHLTDTGIGPASLEQVQRREPCLMALLWPEPRSLLFVLRGHTLWGPPLPLLPGLRCSVLWG